MPGKKEVGSSSNGGEGRQTLEFLSNGPLRNRVVERAVLRSDEGIALVAEFLEVGIVHPYVHRELELANEAGTADKGRDAAFHAVFRCALRKRGP